MILTALTSQELHDESRCNDGTDSELHACSSV